MTRPLEGFIHFNETSHGVAITALAMLFIFGPAIGYTFFNKLGMFSE